MKKPFILIAICLCAVAASLPKEKSPLPKPQFESISSDPAWLSTAVQFHGHLGPWMVAGLRIGGAGRQSVSAVGYFDVEVEVEGPFVRPPHSCFLDGLQISTGATLGKRNLIWKEAKEIVIRVKDTKTGTSAKIRPTEKLLEKVGELAKTMPTVPADAKNAKSEAKETPRHTHGTDDIARSLLTMPDAELFTIKIHKPAPGTKKP